MNVEQTELLLNSVIKHSNTAEHSNFILQTDDQSPKFMLKKQVDKNKNINLLHDKCGISHV